MTITPPANVNYGRVVWQALSDVTDGPDSGTRPDFIAPTGKVTFVASTVVERNATASPNPVSILRDPIVGVLDSEGYLCTPNDAGEPDYRGVDLIATDDPDLNPTDWVYNVSYAVKGKNGRQIALQPHQIYVPTDAVVDLTTVGPVDNATAIGIPQAEALAAQAAAAAEDASVAASQALAAAAAAEAALANVDSTTAENLAEPTSETSAATKALVASDIEDGGPVGDAVSAQIPKVVIDASIAGIKTDGTDQTGALADLISAAAAAGLIAGKSINIRLPLGTVTVNSALPTIDPTRITLSGYGAGATTIDASAATSGPLLKYVIPAGNGTGRVVPLTDIAIRGPQSRSTSVDAIMLNGTSTETSAHLLRFERVTWDGFRDQIIYGSNCYLNSFHGCMFNHARRYAVNYSGGITNSGENEQFIDCVFANGETGIYCNPTTTTPTFTILGTSFDYLDRAWYRGGLGGVFNHFACHFEGDYRTVQITTTSGSTTATVAGSTFFANLDDGKKISDSAGGTARLGAGTTFTVANSTSITLSTAATGSGTFNARVNSRFYAHLDISGAVQDVSTTFSGGHLFPGWDIENRDSFMGITGTTSVQFGQARTSIDGLTTFIYSTRNARNLLWDESLPGGNGIQMKAPNTATFRNLAYTGSPKTAYVANWPLRYRDRTGTLHILTADHEHVIGKQVYGPAFRAPGMWETMSRAESKDKLALTSGTLYLTRLIIEDGGFTQAAAAAQRYYVELGSAGSSVTQFTIGVFYAMASGPSGPFSNTQLVSVQTSNNQSGSLTANAVNKWTVSNTGNISPFSEVWVGVLANGTTPPEVYGRLHAGARGALLHPDLPPVAAKLTGQSSLPSTITRSALVPSEFQPWVLLNPTQN